MRFKFLVILLSAVWLISFPSFSQQGSSDERMFFYHHDHLGSSVCITDSTGQIIQHVEYIPYGEVFIEERNPQSSYATPYKFNGKELDEETGPKSST